MADCGGLRVSFYVHLGAGGRYHRPRLLQVHCRFFFSFIFISCDKRFSFFIMIIIIFVIDHGRERRSWSFLSCRVNARSVETAEYTLGYVTRYCGARDGGLMVVCSPARDAAAECASWTYGLAMCFPSGRGHGGTVVGVWV
jgi:hypothetical protein